MILDHPLVGKRVFYPRPSDLEPDLVVEVEGASLGCYHRRRHPDAGTVVYFHGNGELASWYAIEMAGMFHDMGVNVCFVEYRGYGRSTGRPALSAMRGDGERVVRALGVLPERVVAFGRSIGSLYAIELADRLPGLAGVVIESGIAEVGKNWSLADELAEMGRTEKELARELAAEFDHRKKLAGYRGRLLVLHAEHDRHVNPSHAERLHAWCGCSDKRLVLFPHGDHNSILYANLGDYLRELGEFLMRAGVASPTRGN